MLQKHIYEIKVGTEEDYAVLVNLDLAKQSKIDRFCSLSYYELIGYMGTNLIVISSNLSIKELEAILLRELNERCKIKQLQMYTAEILKEEDHGILKELTEGRAIYLQRNKKNGIFYFEDDTTDKYVNIVAIDPLVFRDLYCLFRLF